MTSPLDLTDADALAVLRDASLAQVAHARDVHNKAVGLVAKTVALALDCGVPVDALAATLNVPTYAVRPIAAGQVTPEQRESDG
jgi:phage-related baseplate assembly protein